jgi:hypothetical protein
MFDYSGLWTILTVVGPILLAAALIYGIVNYQKRSRATKRHTEAATKALYRQGDRRE